MTCSPAVIVHGLAMARTALAAAAGRPIILLSAEGAGAYAGVGWWQALVSAALEEAPGANARHVLDCGGAAGRALEALRAGQAILVLRANPLVWADVSARAAALGATVLPAAPQALDLAEPGALRRLDAWLKEANDAVTNLTR